LHKTRDHSVGNGDAEVEEKREIKSVSATL